MNVEKKSIEDGNLILINEDSSPQKGTDFVWFVWYRVDDDPKYRILLKTFNTKKYNVKEKKEALSKNNMFKEVGLGEWNMSNGKCFFYKAE